MNMIDYLRLLLDWHQVNCNYIVNQQIAFSKDAFVYGNIIAILIRIQIDRGKGFVGILEYRFGFAVGFVLGNGALTSSSMKFSLFSHLCHLSSNPSAPWVARHEEAVSFASLMYLGLECQEL